MTWSHGSQLLSTKFSASSTVLKYPKLGTDGSYGSVLGKAQLHGIPYLGKKQNDHMVTGDLWSHRPRLLPHKLSAPSTVLKCPKTAQNRWVIYCRPDVYAYRALTRQNDHVTQYRWLGHMGLNFRRPNFQRVLQFLNTQIWAPTVPMVQY